MPRGQSRRRSPYLGPAKAALMTRIVTYPRRKLDLATRTDCQPPIALLIAAEDPASEKGWDPMPGTDTLTLVSDFSASRISRSKPTKGSRPPDGSACLMIVFPLANSKVTTTGGLGRRPLIKTRKVQKSVSSAHETIIPF